MRVAAFNVQNLRLRHGPAGPRLDGARDDDAPGETGPLAKALDPRDRALTAQLIAESNADIIALQEVFDQATLDFFHETLLAPRGAVYPYRVCLEGNDGHSRDVALLARRPLEHVASHAALTYAQAGLAPPPGQAASARIFRRDCLAARCSGLWLFVCHFKAGDDAASLAVRQAEAAAVRWVIERCAGRNGRWLALGDFNIHKPSQQADLAPLLGDFGVDLAARLPPDERWTYCGPEAEAYSCPDRIIASPALAATLAAATPEVRRAGLPRFAKAHKGARYAETGERRPRASDHALLLVDLAEP